MANPADDDFAPPRSDVANVNTASKRKRAMRLQRFPAAVIFIAAAPACRKIFMVALKVADMATQLRVPNFLAGTIVVKA